MTNGDEKILHKDLSYKIQGLIFDVRNDLGSGHKESIYQKALENELLKAGIVFTREPAIKIYSKQGEFLGLYRPDFLIENQVIIELKATSWVTRQENARIYDYLRNSQYELAYLVNFGSNDLYYRRFLFTNDRKKWLRTITVTVFVAISTSFVAIRGLPAEAAGLTLGTTAAEVEIGKPFEVGVFLNTQGEQINAVEGRIAFPVGALAFSGVRDPGSVVSFWVERPTVRGAEVAFSGIVPGGFLGDRGYLFSIIFEARTLGEVALITGGERLLRHDGEGTAASVRRAPLRLTVVERIAVPVPGFLPPYDADPPDPFTIELVRDPNLAEGKWVAVFAAQDKGSGINRYEIREHRRAGDTMGGWEVAESPYVLKDHELRSFLTVKAVDNARNERTSVLAPRYPLRWYERYGARVGGAVGVLVACLIAIVVTVWKKRRNGNAR